MSKDSDRAKSKDLETRIENLEFITSKLMYTVVLMYDILRLQQGKPSKESIIDGKLNSIQEQLEL